MAPNLMLTSLLDSIAPESLAWWLSRLTLICALACVYLAFARRARPAARHMVAVAGLSSIVALPLATALLPSVPLPVLPASVTGDTPAGDDAWSGAVDTSPSPVAPAPLTTEPAPALESAPATAGLSAAPTEETTTAATTPVNWSRVAALAWITVAVVLLLHVRAATAAARRIARRAVPAEEANLAIECSRAARTLGILHPVDVGISADVTIPVVVGAVHPRVILPAAATEWSRERLRVVLLHEFAHVRRRDGLWVLVARLATAILWFHPLVWALSGHVRRESERACDDMVLATGIRGSDYAAHLVSIARTAMAREPFAGAALAFTTRSTLERRVASILSTRTPHAAMSRRALASAACVSLILLAAIAAVRPTEGNSAQVTSLESMSFNHVESFHYEMDTFDNEVDALADGAATHAVMTTYASADEAPAPAPRARAPRDARIYLADDEDPQSPRAWYHRADDYYRRGRWASAADAYQKAAQGGFRRGTAYYNAGCSYALDGQKDKAISMLQESFEEGFDRPDLFATDEDLNSLRDDTRFRKLLDGVMNSGEAQGARRAATRDFERLAADKDVEDGAWNSVGIDLLRSGDYAKAADAFDREFAVSKDEDALYNKACARSLAGKTDEALKLLEQSIATGSVDADHMEEDPDLVALHGHKRFGELVTLADDLTLHPGGNNWGRGDDEKRWRKNLPRYEQVAQKHPQIGRAWFNLGYAQLAAEEPAKATASFTKALDLGYRPAITQYNLACSTAQSGDINGAFTWLDKAEASGMEMWGHAQWDEDLDPLRADPRFREYKKKWKAEAKKHKKHAHAPTPMPDFDYHWEDRDDEDAESDT